MNAIANHGPDAPAEDIRFGFGGSPLGTILVAAGEKGVAAILMGNDRDALGRDLADAFSHARLGSEEAGLEAVAAQVVAFLDAPHDMLPSKLDDRRCRRSSAVR